MTDAQEIRADNGEVHVGQIFEGRFEILSVLGQGGMGMVYRARHTHMDKIVAMKTLVQGAVYDDISFLRFEQEARTAASLEHPNIITIYDFGRTKQGLAYLVMEYINGPTLEDVIVEIDSLPLHRFMRIFGQACEGMQHAHKKGIIHRDLKPSNLMLYDAEDYTDKVKIVDFGLAKLAQDDTQKLTQSGMVMGSPLYMSPEQGRGDELDARSDIYSLGCVMYVALSGHVPLKGNNSMATIYKHISDVPPLMSAVAPHIQIPRRLEQLVMRTLEKDPANRPQSMAELQHEMNEAITSTDTTKPLVVPTLPSDLSKTVPSGHGINSANLSPAAGPGPQQVQAPPAMNSSNSSTPVARPNSASRSASSEPAAAQSQNNLFKLAIGAVVVLLLAFSFMQISAHKNTSVNNASPISSVSIAPASKVLTGIDGSAANTSTVKITNGDSTTNSSNGNVANNAHQSPSSTAGNPTANNTKATGSTSNNTNGGTTTSNTNGNVANNKSTKTAAAIEQAEKIAAQVRKAGSNASSAVTAAIAPTIMKGELSTEKAIAHKLINQYGAEATAALKAGDLEEAIPWLEKQLQQEKILYSTELDPRMIVTLTQLIHAHKSDQFEEGSKQTTYLELALKAFSKDRNVATKIVNSKTHGWQIWKQLADACFAKANLLPGPFKMAYQEWATVFYSLAESTFNGKPDKNYFEMLAKTYICAKRSGNLELCGKVGAILTANGQPVPAGVKDMPQRMMNRPGTLREFGRGVLRRRGFDRNN